MKCIVFFVVVISYFATISSMKINAISRPKGFDESDSVFSNYSGLLNKTKTSEKYQTTSTINKRGPRILTSNDRSPTISTSTIRVPGITVVGRNHGNMMNIGNSQNSGNSVNIGSSQICNVKFDRNNNAIEDANTKERCPKITRYWQTCVVSDRYVIVNSKVVYEAPKGSQLCMKDTSIFVNGKLACDLSKGIMYIESE